MLIKGEDEGTEKKGESPEKTLHRSALGRGIPTSASRPEKLFHGLDHHQHI